MVVGIVGEHLLYRGRDVGQVRTLTMHAAVGGGGEGCNDKG